MAYVGTAKDLGNARDTLASVLEGEAGNQGLKGMRAVASVILNRTAKNFSGYGTDYVDQVTAKKQFQGQSTPSSLAYKVADELLNGQLKDITGGALYYAEPSNSTASWAKNLDSSNAVKIGSHYFTNNTQGKPFTGTTATPPMPSMLPGSIAIAQNSPQTAIDAISGLAGAGANTPTPSLSYAASPPSVDEIASNANRVAANLPFSAPAFVPSTDYAGMDRLIQQNYGGLGDIIRNRFDPGFVYQTPSAPPVPSPVPIATPTSRQMASVSIPPTSYKVNLDSALNYARDTGQLSGIPAMLPNGALYGVAQNEIAKNIPSGASYDPQTNTVSVQNRGLLTNPPVDPSTGSTANIQDYVDRGIATPLNRPTTETIPLPVPRPERSAPSQTKYPDISKWDVFANPAPEAFVAGVNAPLPAMPSRPTPAVPEQTPSYSGVDTSSIAGILKASGMGVPNIPYAAGTIIPDKNQARLLESDPRLAFAADPLAGIPQAPSIVANAPYPAARPSWLSQSTTGLRLPGIFGVIQSALTSNPPQLTRAQPSRMPEIAYRKNSDGTYGIAHETYNPDPDDRYRQALVNILRSPMSHESMGQSGSGPQGKSGN